MKLGRMLCRPCPGWLFFDDRLQPNWHQRSRMSYRHADSIHPHISLIHPPAKSLSNAAPKSKFSVVLGPSGPVKIYAQIYLQAPADLKSAGNRGVVQSCLQVLHVHVFLVAPLGARHMAQPRADRRSAERR